MTNKEKCAVIRLNSAAVRLHMVLDHALHGSSELNHKLVETGIESLQHAIAEYQTGA